MDLIYKTPNPESMTPTQRAKYEEALKQLGKPIPFDTTPYKQDFCFIAHVEENEINKPSI